MMELVHESDRIDLHISAKGGYYWDIRIIGTDTKKLEDVNNQMKKRFKSDEIDSIDI